MRAGRCLLRIEGRFRLQDWTRIVGSGAARQGEQAGNGLDRLRQSVKQSIKVCAYCCRYEDGVCIGLEWAELGSNLGSSPKTSTTFSNKDRVFARKAESSAIVESSLPSIGHVK
jgi:hypothetical protein